MKIDNEQINNKTTLSPEHKAKLLEANIGKPKSPEHKEAISKALTGRKLSPEHAKALTTSRTGKKNTPEHNAKIGEASKNRRHTEESKVKMSESAKQRSPISEETRVRMSEAHIGKKITQERNDELQQIRQKPIQIDGIIYSSIKEASEAIGMTRRVLTKRLDSDNYTNFVRLEKE